MSFSVGDWKLFKEFFKFSSFGFKLILFDILFKLVEILEYFLLNAFDGDSKEGIWYAENLFSSLLLILWKWELVLLLAVFTKLVKSLIGDVIIY